MHIDDKMNWIACPLNVGNPSRSGVPLFPMSRLNRCDSQAGGIMAATIVMLAGLAAITGLTVLSVRRSLGATTQQRAHAQAVNAAESGLSVASKYLRDSYALHPITKFTPELNNPGAWNTVYGAGRAVGPLADYPFGDSRFGYDIAYRNNASDPGGPLLDTDGAIVIVVTGCTGAKVQSGLACGAPGGALARLEVEVVVAGGATSNAGAGYAQQNQNELGTGQLTNSIQLTGQVTTVLPQ